MSKIEAAVAKLTIVMDANVQIAHQKGRIARAYGRANTGVLVPKLESEEEHAAWQAGWTAADAQLKAE